MGIVLELLVRGFLFLSLVLAGGCAGLPEPFLPPYTGVPSAAVFVRLHAFNTGTVTVPRGAAARGQGWFSRVTMDVPAFVLEHPTEGLIVFDLGLPPQIADNPRRHMGRLNHFFAPFRMQKGQELPVLMKRAGLDPARVRWVILSHRHFDHVGSLREFSQATVVVSRREWEAARGLIKGQKDREPPPAERFDGLTTRLIDFSTAPAYAAFEHGVDLLGDGSLILLDASGHTAGSMAAFARVTPYGALMTGDASWTQMNWSLPAPQIYAWDKALAWRRLWQIRSWKSREPGLLVLAGHDLGPLRESGAAGILH